MLCTFVDAVLLRLFRCGYRTARIFCTDPNPQKETKSVFRITDSCVGHENGLTALHSTWPTSHQDYHERLMMQLKGQRKVPQCQKQPSVETYREAGIFEYSMTKHTIPNFLPILSDR